MNKPYSLQSGMTLVELMVAVTLFVVVAVVASGLMLKLADASEKGQALTAALSNMDAALEQMSRSLRTGFNYDCTGQVTPQPNDCETSGGPTISFEDEQEDDPTLRYVKYFVDSNKTIYKQKGGTQAQPLTAPEVFVEDLRFYVEGASRDDGLQPHVIITIQGRTNVLGLREEEQADFEIQTTVTQRLPDIFVTELP